MEREEEEERRENEQVIYKVEDVPPPHLCILFGLQQAIMCIGGSLSLPFILTNILCAEGQDDVRAKLLSITMFMSGVASLIQTTFGIRLPVIQGGSHTYVPPIVAMMTLDKFKCSVIDDSNRNVSSNNITDDWTFRMREIQGNLILASITQVVVGCSGIIGFLMNFIGPLTIAPTISLIGLSLGHVAADFCEKHWGISTLTVCLILLFSVYINKIKVPLPGFNLKQGCHVTRFPLFQLLSIILPVCISWILCYILTITNVFPTDKNQLAYSARTDSRLNILNDAPWIYLPYPLQFGLPTFSAAVFVGMMAATISSVMESVGDYFASARLSCATPPPPHAINRGIFIEGFASIFSGLVGAGHATTTYSNNIGIIGTTKVASRAVFQTASIILILSGLVGKFGAGLALIPDPIVGGTLLIGLALVVSIGISVLQFCDMSSTRNMTILGVSMLVGLMLPDWIQDNPDKIKTGSDDLDQVIQVLAGTASFTGGIIGFVLDNTVPGTKEERGITRWRLDQVGKPIPADSPSLKIYELPLITKYLRKSKFFTYIPFLPTFDKEINCSCQKCHRQTDEPAQVYELDVETGDETKGENIRKIENRHTNDEGINISPVDSFNTHV